MRAGAVTAYALAFLQHMFGHLNGYRRQVETLAPHHTGDRPPGQIPPTISARSRLVYPPMMRGSHLLQRFACMAWLPTRLTTRPAPQRTRFGCRLGQPIRRRRPIRVTGMGTQPRLQLRNLRLRCRQLGPRLDQFAAKRNDQRGKFLIRGTRQVIGHHPTLEIYT